MGTCFNVCVIGLALILLMEGAISYDPTDGFTQVTLASSNFLIQKPYDVPTNQRYTFADGVHKMWVYSTDKPYSPATDTKPRTEIRVKGYDYTSGVWQFEGKMYVPRGTTGVSVMQIFGAIGSATTTTQLRIYDGELRYFNSGTIASNVYDKWLRVNVIHDVGANKVRVFVDGAQKSERSGRGPGASHFFKFGVYAQEGASNYMECRWKDVKIFKK